MANVSQTPINSREILQTAQDTESLPSGLSGGRGSGEGAVLYKQPDPQMKRDRPHKAAAPKPPGGPARAGGPGAGAQQVPALSTWVPVCPSHQVVGPSASQG